MSRVLDENPEAVMVSSLVEPIDALGNAIREENDHDYWLDWYGGALEETKKEQPYILSLLKSNFIVSTSNIFIRASFFQDHPAFDGVLSYCHDYEFLLRVLRDHRMVLINEKLLKYRLHEKNTIRENEFLKHLEVSFAVFKAMGMADFFDKIRAGDERGLAFLGGLLENPEVNPQIDLERLEEIVQQREKQLLLKDNQVAQAEAWLKEKQANLEQADIMLKDLQDQRNKLQGKLEDHAAALRKQAETIEKQRIQIKTKEDLLKEIFESRAWKWLTRYRKIKYKLFPRENLKRGQKGPKKEDNSYHVRIIGSIQPSRPKIMHAIANFMTGGSSRLIVDLIEHLGHKYHQEVMAFFCPSPPAYTGVKLHDFSGPVKAEAVSSFLKQKEIEILHVHYWGECDEKWYRTVFEAGEQSDCMVIENVNTPVATLVHDGIDQYVYVSEYAMGYSQPIPENAVVIYPGSNLSLFERQGSPVPDDAIGMVYRLEGDKLRKDAIQVFIDVVKKRPSTRAYVIGGGTFLEPYKKQVSEAGVSDHFVFTGYVPYEKLPEYYRRFSLFVAPVWKESFGQVSPFAMGMAIPVTGYDVGALSEILGGNECLGRDQIALVQIITRLLEDRNERIKIGNANRQRALKHFSLEAMIDQYDALYRRLLTVQSEGRFSR
jgi:glycosyltransferase involved in cell wall biosynthesis